MTNRLASATSPYLLQHRDNPVDWWPWGAEAFAQARIRDVPIFLSVGYAACHWCHVMARESFEDPVTARALLDSFVSIKVDREERPDIDAVYLEATQVLSGQGGWPMSVFLTPDGRPFYAGTYFPPRPLAGRPSFGQVIEAVAAAWRDRRDELDAVGTDVVAALRARSLSLAAEGPAADGPAADGPAADGPAADGPAADGPAVDRSGADGSGADGSDPLAVIEEAVESLAGQEDATYGGFGGAPKFPPSMTMEFLLRHAASRDAASPRDGASPRGAAVSWDAASASRAVARGIADRTLRAMGRSGLYDQLAGGFARYCVDRQWIVPHFEKMLYDNAQLARVYLHWWRLTGEPDGARIAVETCDWMVADLRTAEGGFASSLDADSPRPEGGDAGHGGEGLAYVWTPAQLRQVLGDDDGAWAARILGVTDTGTFAGGASTVRLTRDVWASPAEARRWRTVRAALLAARGARPRPARDDKVVAAWNGLAVAALAETGALLGRPDLVAAAETAADLLLSVHRPSVDGPAVDRGGSWRRVSRGGVVGEPAAVLEDYGDVAEGLFALFAVTGRARWREAALALVDEALTRFREDGVLYDTAGDATDVPLLAVRRPRDPTDGACPGGTSAIAGALLTCAGLTGSARYREAVGAALATVRRHGAASPQAFGWGLAVLRGWLDGPIRVGLVGDRDDPHWAVLHRVALAGTAPGLVVDPDPSDAPGPTGGPVAVVCRDERCLAPTSDPARLADDLGARPATGGGSRTAGTAGQ